MKSVAIIGAGTIGLHCAYYLHRSGHQVSIIESLPENSTESCSFGNCGFIVPSHFISVASPAILKSGLKLIFNSKSPVALSLVKNRNQLPWFLQFIQMAKTAKVNRSAPLLYQLNAESLKLYAEINQQYQTGNEFGSNGLLMVTQTDKKMDEEIRQARIATYLGIKTTILSPEALNRLEPQAKFQVKGAVYYHSDGHIHPAKHVSWLRHYLKQQGVQFHYNQPISRIDHSKGRITKLETDNDKFEADEFILAAGVFSRHLAREISVNCPVISGKGYSFDFPYGYGPLKTPVILTEAMVALAPFENGLRLGSGMEFNARPGHPDWKRIQSMLDKTHEAIGTFPILEARRLKVWEGMRPVTPDGVPLIGRTRCYRNLLIATGHAMMGSSLAPITGKLITALINREKTIVKMEQLHPDRFN